MNIKYPNNIKSNLDKLSYVYRLQGLLIEEHNQKGVDFKNKSISRQDWDNYKRGQFQEKMDAITKEICKYRDLVRKDANTKANLEKDFIE